MGDIFRHIGAEEELAAAMAAHGESERDIEFVAGEPERRAADFNCAAVFTALHVYTVVQALWDDDTIRPRIWVALRSVGSP